MNRDEIDTLWQQALHKSVQNGEMFTRYDFAALIAAAEREACAKLCDDIDVEYEGEDVLATWCAQAIRARGKA